MKRIFALLALVGAVSFGAPSWAEEKAAAPEAAAATVPGTVFARTSFIDGKIASFYFKPIEFRNSFLSCFIRTHFHESKSSGPPGVKITHNSS